MLLKCWTKIILVALLLPSRSALSQEGVPEAKVYSQAVTFNGEQVFVGPDPDDLLALINLLNSSEIAEEIEISKEQLEALGKVRRASQQIVGDIIERRIEKRISSDEFNIADAARKAELRTAVEEIIGPAETERLMQLAYRQEVEYAGWALALTRGRLSSVAGVYPNQHAKLSARIAEIESQMKAKILSAKKEAEQLVLEELAPEQRKRAEDALGPFFLFEALSPQRQIVNDYLDRLRNKESEKVEK